MERVPVSSDEFGPVGLTLLTPLWGRAHAAELVPETAFRDPAAAEMLATLDFDASTVVTDPANAGGSVLRAVVLDELTVAFTGRHPDALVVSAGIGLCTRHQRLAGRVPGTVRWVGVDSPEVIALRRRLVADDVELVPATLDHGDWTDAIDDDGRPVLVLAEGVLMYLDEAGVAAFLAAARRRFGRGTELAADVFNPLAARSGRHPITRATGAPFRSGHRHGRALAAASPGWRAVEDHDVLEDLSPRHRFAGRAFRLVTGGSRLYVVAHLAAG
jgi:O-methyltransferase